MENSLDKQKVDYIISIFKDSVKKSGDDIKRITGKPMLLGPDGKPSKEALETVRVDITNMLKEKASSPTILQHLENKDLAELHDVGASFKVAHIVGVTITGAVGRILAGIDPESASALVFMALTEIANPNEDSLYVAVDKFLKIDKRDEHGNVILFPADEKKKIVMIALTVLTRAFMANELVTQIDDDSIQITSTGLGVINHLSAVDAVINIIDHSQIQNAVPK